MAENDLRAVAFPTLDERQIAALGRCTGAVLKRYQAWEKLFEVGDRDFKFFVIKSGEVEILDEIRRDAEDCHGPPARRVHGRRGASNRQTVGC